MTGVAGPMLRSNSAAAARFMLGFALGQLTAAATLSILIAAVGLSLAVVAPWPLRVFLFLAVAASLCLADFVGRIPQLERQVPVDLYHRLEPGRLGFVWGADIGLLFTTRKTTSMPWLGLVGAATLAPAASLAFLTAFGLASTGTLLVTAYHWRRSREASARRYLASLKISRLVSAGLIPALAIVLAVAE